VSRQLEGRELFCLAGKGEEHGSGVRWDKRREKGDGKREVGSKRFGIREKRIE
jgi:hypothetical protein